MIIGVDTEQIDGTPGNFLNECLQRIIPVAKAHQFILIGNDRYTKYLECHPNCTCVVPRKKSHGLFFLKEINQILKTFLT